MHRESRFLASLLVCAVATACFPDLSSLGGGPGSGSDPNSSSSESSSSTSTNGSTSSSSVAGYWSRSDGGGTAYLWLSGSTAKACTGGTETVGSFNASKPSMTFVISGETLTFPLSISGSNLIVGVPAQSVDTHNSAPYVRTTSYPCGSSGGSTTTQKGQVVIWTDKTPGWIPTGWKGSGTGVHETMSISAAGKTSSISAGHFSSAPSCGATYAVTWSLAPGNYSVTGTVYFLKDVYGNSYPNYSTSKSFTVVANQCTQVVLR